MPRKATGQKSKLEEKVWSDLVAMGLHEGCIRQYKFHPERQWAMNALVCVVFKMAMGRA